jgi:S-methylmethionine-dependent homocysteine/selenocysteine methylase
VVHDWLRDGATLIGGCCELGPADIAAIAARL